jgi:hypothetical protein
LSISQVWLVDSLMQALAAVLHGASVDGSGFGGAGFEVGGLGVVVVGIGVDDLVVVLVVLDG